MFASLVSPHDRLREKLVGLVVQHPARHVRRLAPGDGDDDVAVERPGVLAVVLARPGGVVRVAVVEPQHRLALGVGFALGLELRPRVDREPVVALVGREHVLPRLQPLDQSPAALVAPDQDAAALVRVSGGAFGFDPAAQAGGQYQWRCGAHGQISASLSIDSRQKLSERYLAAESQKIVTTTPSFNSDATFIAAARLPPEETPTSTPSSRARRRAM